MADQPKLQALGLTKSYHGNVILDHVNLEVQAGQVVAVLGPSGSGKSTMLRLLSLLEPPTDGRILLDGKELGVVSRSGRSVPASETRLAEQRTDLGMVFQSFNLFPHLNVLDNITLASRVVLKTARKDAEARAEALLERVGLLDHRRKFPSELSGGQQQRVAIARALILSPKVMLFDEPTSALDPELVREVLAVMEGLAEGGMTMVVVTHEIGFARRVANQVALFDKGSIVEQSAPDDFFSSRAHPRVQQFLQHVM